MVTNRLMWHKLGEPQKLLRIMDYLISGDEIIRVKIGGEKETYSSKILQVSPPYQNGDSRAGSRLILEKLSPEEGNYLIQSNPEIRLEFAINDGLYRCSSRFLGTSSEYPLVGLIVSFPKYLEVNEKRRDERYVYDVPEMVSVEIPLKDEMDRLMLYELNVCDCSRYGLGLLVRKKDFGMLKHLHPGDRVEGMTFYALSAKITVDGIVRHKTQIRQGRYKGCYVLGIESQAIVENCGPTQ